VPTIRAAAAGRCLREIVLYVYELDPVTHQYVPTGIFHDRVKLTVPFEIDIDLTEIDRM